MAVVERLAPAPGQRLIVISDIHGNLPLLKGALAAAEAGPEDILILLGDLCEKGPESLATLRYVMGLRERLNLHAVQGNCDAWYLFADGTGKDPELWLRKYLFSPKPGRGPGLLTEMAREQGLPLAPDMDLGLLRQMLREHYAPEMDFLRANPHILDTPDYTFVHGGLPPADVPWEEAPGWDVMKCDDYARRCGVHEKWTVAGHTPVQLYHGGGRICASPYIDAEKRLISIDGGCVLMDDGQLNVLLLRDGEMECISCDGLPEATALDAQAESRSSRYISWADNAVELVEEQGDFVRIRQRSSGYEMEVPADWLRRGADGTLKTYDCSDYELPVAPGDRVKLVRRTSRGYWIKKNGVSGWYRGRVEAIES